MRASKTYALFFLVASVMSLVCSVLVVIYSATGLATDSGFPGGFVLDEDSGELIPVSQVNLPQRERQMMLNLLLIILGVLEIIFTLPCCIICLREICQCYDERAMLMRRGRSAQAISKEPSIELMEARRKSGAVTSLADEDSAWTSNPVHTSHARAPNADDH